MRKITAAIMKWCDSLVSLQAALHGSWGMDMLVVVGTTISYLYSTMSLLLACVLDAGQGDDGTGIKRHPHLFLESPAMLLSFVTLGE